MSRRKNIAAHESNGTHRPSVHGVASAGAQIGTDGAPKKPKFERAASKAWDELVSLLKDRLKPEDAPQLEQAANWLAQFRAVLVKLQAADPGTLAYSRLLSALSLASKNFDRIAKRFGLSPLDRDSLNLQPAKPGVLTW